MRSRILTVERGERAVEAAGTGPQIQRAGEEHLGGHGEVLSRVRSGVRPQHALAPSPDTIEGTPHHPIELATQFPIGDRRQAVGETVELVDLVGELVQDDVAPTGRPTQVGPHLRPREHQRAAAVTGLAGERPSAGLDQPARARRPAIGDPESAGMHDDRRHLGEGVVSVGETGGEQGGQVHDRGAHRVVEFEALGRLPADAPMQPLGFDTMPFAAGVVEVGQDPCDRRSPLTHRSGLDAGHHGPRLGRYRADVASLELALDGVRVVLEPDSGGRIAQLELDGHRILHDTAGTADDPTATGWGSFPMAPYAGRVRHGRFAIDGVEHRLPLRIGPHAMHGTVLDRPWTVTGHTTVSCSMRTGLGDDWPWEGWCEQHLELDGERLALRLEVHSSGDPFPASAGWHPWFRTRLPTGAALNLDVAADAMVGRDAEGIPTGEWGPPSHRPWDDCLRDVEWPVRLRWVSDGRVDIGVDVWADTRFVVIYDRPDHAWCVEPQTAPPDALGTTADVVTPEHPLVVTGEWRWIRAETPYLSGE